MKTSNARCLKLKTNWGNEGDYPLLPTGGEAFPVIDWKKINWRKMYNEYALRANLIEQT